MDEVLILPQFVEDPDAGADQARHDRERHFVDEAGSEKLLGQVSAIDVDLLDALFNQLMNQLFGRSGNRVDQTTQLVGNLKRAVRGHENRRFAIWPIHRRLHHEIERRAAHQQAIHTGEQVGKAHVVFERFVGFEEINRTIASRDETVERDTHEYDDFHDRSLRRGRQLGIAPAPLATSWATRWHLLDARTRMFGEVENMSEAETRSEALEAAKARRVELKSAVSSVERAAARPSSKPSWREDLLHELDDLRVAVDEHVDEVEGEEGLLAELMFTVPRLANKIDRIQAEHPGLQTQVAETIETVTTSDDLETVRDAVLGTLVSIARHRQKGADLVYEGYSVDIGGG